MNAYYECFKIIQEGKFLKDDGKKIKSLIGEKTFNEITKDISEPPSDGDKFAQFVMGFGDFMYQFKFREYFVNHYAWAITDPVAIDFISQHCKQNELKIIEMGAGTGYWSNLISKNGVYCICYDAEQPKISHSTIHYGGAERIREHKNKTLFLCWPPYSTPFAHECLKNYKGEYVFYIGENEGGCCGDDNYFKYLEKNFEIEKTISIAQWRGLHDSLFLYKRK